MSSSFYELSYYFTCFTKLLTLGTSYHICCCFDFRCTATQALKSSYFSNPPAPTPGPKLPMPRSRKEVEYDINREIMAARKRGLEDSNDGLVVAKRLQF